MMHRSLSFPATVVPSKQRMFGGSSSKGSFLGVVLWFLSSRLKLHLGKCLSAPVYSVWFNVDRGGWVGLLLLLGRARWGGSGALYPKSAIAGLNPYSRLLALWACPY